MSEKSTPAKLAMTPIGDIARNRLPQIGRIRMGKKTKSSKGKMIPTTSETWILTSSRKNALEALAARYGGEVKEWEDTTSKDRYVLETTTDVITVMLHPDGMQEPRYEKWMGKKCTRRCDGVTCTATPKNGDEPIEIACPCNATGDVQCKPTTHLNFMLPETTVGFWRLTSGSFTAIPELFGSVQVIQAATERGYPYAELRIDKREGDGKRWSVPVLTSASTMGELLSDETRVEIAAPKASTSTAPAIEYSTGDDWDEQIEDAEIVEDDDTPEFESITVAKLNKMVKAGGMTSPEFMANAKKLGIIADEATLEQIAAADYGDQKTLIEQVITNMDATK